MTKSDRDIERLLEDWLDDEARPMPQHVLESSLEAVSREGQVGTGRSPWPVWATPRTWAVAMAAAVVVLAVIAGPTIFDTIGGLLAPRPGAPTPSPGEPMVWDPAADWRLYRNPGPDQHGNPDVWSYLQSTSDRHVPDTYELLPDIADEGGNQYWLEDVARLSPAIGHVRGDRTIWLHPWSDGVRANNRHAILRWQSPVTGSVRVEGQAEHAEPTCVATPTDGTFFTIDKEGTTLLNYSLPPGYGRDFSTTVDVVSGQSLYFVVDPGRASNCDTTRLQLRITYE